MRNSFLIISVFLFILLAIFGRASVTYANIQVDGVEIPAPFDIDRINSFHSDITINQNGSLSIKETLLYETTLEKHGIYRYIPFKTRRNGLTVHNSLDKIIITDESGKPYPFTRSSENGNLMLKIGDPDITFSGTKTYIISYTAEDVLIETDTGPRLLWDITGEGWQIPVMKTTVRIHSPFAPVMQLTCYSGEFGGNDGLCTGKQENDATAYFAREKYITYGENVTVDLTLSSQNQLTLPTHQQRRIKLIRENFWVIFLPLPTLILAYYWLRYGRDYMFIRPNVFDHHERPTQLRPVFARFPAPMVYEPLDISPGQAGAILDERYDTSDLVADILDLARQKYLRIEQTQEKSLFKSADYTFFKLKEKNATLPLHQQKILSGMFGQSSQVTLSQMKGKFYIHLEKIKNAVFASLYDHTMFTRDPVKTKTIIIFILFGGFFAAVFILIPLFQTLSFNSPLALIGLLVQSPFLILLTINMNQKTAKGFNYMQQARGLKDTIARGKWREQIKEKHLFIEEILPFAVSLGVVEKLSRDMRELGIKPPEYLHTSSIHTWSNAAFISSFSREVGSSMTYNPSSSSSSGGGSSGGGGGGGGGGSW